MNKQKWKKILIPIFTTIIVIGVYFYLGMVLMPKDYEDLGGLKYYSATAYKHEEKNTLDVMMFGNSDLYSGVIPMEIYKSAGITSFSCGAAKQTMSSVYKQVKKSIKRQKLKVVMLETDCIYYPNKKLRGSFLYEFIPFGAPFKYHARWKELEFKDFIKAPILKGKNNFLKGYVFSNNIGKYNLKDDFMKDVDAEPRKIQESVVKDFDKIYKLCKKEKIPMLLFECPSPSSWSCAKSKGVQKLVDEYNAKDPDYQISFIDFNLGLEGFDYKLHFKDKGNHCNYAGAKIITDYLCNFLQENFELTDRRGDDKYKTWDRCLDKYEAYLRKHL